MPDDDNVVELFPGQKKAAPLTPEKRAEVDAWLRDRLRVACADLLKRASTPGVSDETAASLVGAAALAFDVAAAGD